MTLLQDADQYILPELPIISFKVIAMDIFTDEGVKKMKGAARNDNDHLLYRTLIFTQHTALYEFIWDFTTTNVEDDIVEL